MTTYKQRQMPEALNKKKEDVEKASKRLLFSFI